MKTRHFIFAIALAVLASCSKSSLEPVAPQEQVTSQELKVNMTVSCDGAETKAIKSSWAEGDKISIFFYAECFGGSLPADVDTHLTLTYKSSKWEAEFAPGIASKLLETTSGHLSAVYTQNQNDTFKYSSYWKYYDHTSQAGYYLYQNAAGYTITDGVLSAAIDLKFYSNAQVFMISGVNYEEGRYALSCNNLLKSNLGSFWPDTGFSTANSSNGDFVDGYDNCGAASFYGLRANNAENVNMTYEFSLVDRVAKKRYVLTLYNKKCTERFIILPALSEWSEAPALYVSPTSIYTYPGYLTGSVKLYDSVNGTYIPDDQVEWTMLGSLSLAEYVRYNNRDYVKGLTFYAPSITQSLQVSYQGEKYLANVYSTLACSYQGKMQWLQAGNDGYNIKLKASDTGTARFYYKNGEGNDKYAYVSDISGITCDCVTFTMTSTATCSYEVSATATPGIHPMTIKINGLELTSYVNIQE